MNHENNFNNNNNENDDKKSNLSLYIISILAGGFLVYLIVSQYMANN